VQKPNSEKIGLGLSSLLIAVFAILFAAYDLNGVSSGQYDYIYSSEVGLLLIMAVIALGLAIPAVVQKSRLSAAGLTLSLIALLMAFASARYGG
jgi:hypothetical protein